MKKIILIASCVALLTTCAAFAAKYKVNTSGVVKNNYGTVVTPSPATVTPIVNPYNVYNAQTYVSQNVVNRVNIPTIEIVMDYSGSMSNWINQAKLAMRNIIAQIPPQTKVGFRVFGHDAYGTNPSNKATVAAVKKIVKKNGKYQVQTAANPLGTTTGYCAATQQVTPIIQANSAQLLNGMSSVSIGGATPLVYGLDRAVNQDFRGMSQDFPKKIILITDGGENCGGDPCAFAEQLMRQRSDVHIDVVLVSTFTSSLNCLATKTGGHVYRVNNLSNFQTVMTQSMTTPATEVQETTPNQNYEFIKN